MQIKSYNLEGTPLLDFYYDTQPLVNDNTEVEFFPRSTTLGITDQNYEQQPFSPTNLDTHILAIGFQPTLPWVKEVTNINANTLYQALVASRLQIEIGSRIVVKKLTFAQVADLTGVEFFTQNKFASDALTGSVQNFFWPGSVVMKLEEPIRIPAGTVFGLKLFLDSSFALPTAAHWVTAAQGGAWGLRCEMQFAREKMPEEITKLDLV